MWFDSPYTTSYDLLAGHSTKSTTFLFLGYLSKVKKSLLIVIFTSKAFRAKGDYQWNKRVRDLRKWQSNNGFKVL